MNDKKTLAFPQCRYNMTGGYDTTGGMTLRDYFAAKALNFTLKNCFTTEGAVERSYEIADEMLKVRAL